jgi:hypothetical protein
MGPCGHIFQQLEAHPVLHSLNLEDLNLFIWLAAQLRRDIQLLLPLNQSNPEDLPDILPPTIEEFLCRAIGIPLNCVGHLWDILKEDVWSASPSLFFEDDLELFKEHGWALGLSQLR